jgi:hypothetical protein
MALIGFALGVFAFMAVTLGIFWYSSKLATRD